MRTVVIGKDGQRRVRASTLRRRHAADCACRVVRAAAGDDRDAAGGLIDADFDHAIMFIGYERRGLPGRAAGHKPMTSFDNLPIDEIPIRGLVKRFVAKWRHQSRYRPAKPDSFLHLGSVRGHRLVRTRSWPDKEGAGMMSILHKKTVDFHGLIAS